MGAPLPLPPLLCEWWVPKVFINPGGGPGLWWLAIEDDVDESFWVVDKLGLPSWPWTSREEGIVLVGIKHGDSSISNAQKIFQITMNNNHYFSFETQVC